MAQQNYEATIAAVPVPPEFQQFKEAIIQAIRDLDKRTAALE